MMREQKGIYIPEQDKAKFWGENFEIREYNKLNLKGKVAIDIGAHVGIWTRRLAVNFCQVYAFEPMPKHIECHKENCKGLDNVILMPYALSNQKASGVMTTKDNNSGMSTLIDQELLNWKKPQTVQLVDTNTLDNFDIKPTIDFIKIDVEGWEEQVLEGAWNTIMKYRPRMYIEIWRDRYERVSDMLYKEMDYTLQQVSKSNYLCEPMQ